MRDSRALRVMKNVLVLHRICGGEYTLFFVTVSFGILDRPVIECVVV